MNFDFSKFDGFSAECSDVCWKAQPEGRGLESQVQGGKIFALHLYVILPIIMFTEIEVLLFYVTCFYSSKLPIPVINTTSLLISYFQLTVLMGK